MVSIYNCKRNVWRNGKPYLLVELRGLSTDDKPIVINDGNIENGSSFIEMDTQDIYFYDLTSLSWIKPSEESEE